MNGRKINQFDCFLRFKKKVFDIYICGKTVNIYYYRYISTSFNGPLEFYFNFDNISNSTTNDSFQVPQTSQQTLCTLTALLRQSAFPDMSSFTRNNDYTICQQNLSSLSSNNVTCKVGIEYPLMSTWYYVSVSSDCNYTIGVALPNVCQQQRETAGQTPIVLLNNQTYSSLIDNLKPKVMESTSTPPSSQQYCSKLSQPIETFRFIGPTYFSVKYYFNSNYNRSNALLVRNEKTPYFIEFLVDLANNGGIILSNNTLGYLFSINGKAISLLCTV